MALFAATARQECGKKECKSKECWGTKNHPGFPALPKLKLVAAAATSEDIPQNYGPCQPCGSFEQNPPQDDDGFTKVAGTFVASVAPPAAKVEVSNRFVPPSTFAEALSEDED